MTTGLRRLRGKKVDANQAEIVTALRKAGCRVLSLAPMGKNVADLLVSYRGQLYLLEVKMPAAAIRDDQVAWLNEWGGTLVRGPIEALRAVGATA